MFNLGLIRFLPSSLRPLLILAVDALHGVVTRVRQRREMRRTGRNTFPPDAPVTLIGLFASPTGIGQGVRLMWRDLQRRGRAVTAVDATATLHIPGDQRPEGALDVTALETLPPGPIILHLNPPLYEAMYFLLPHDLRQRARLIGYWAWELDRMPTAWLHSASMCDEFWVPSDFVAQAMRRLLGPYARQPICVVPHAVDAIPLGPRKTQERRSAARQRHDLPDDAFLVGYSFTMSSNFERKNPLAAITAFRAAFPASTVRDVALILRCNDIDSWPPGSAAVRDAAANDPRILVVDGEARRMPIRDLYEAVEVYLSLHRSEGYGLTLAEAADLGTSVIATGWGLAADIAARPEVAGVGWRLVPVEDPQGTYRLRDANWAEPDLVEAAQKLRALYDARPGSNCSPHRVKQNHV
jgi:glycosyltransferase involved in cell wall biosynthesis